MDRECRRSTFVNVICETFSRNWTMRQAGNFNIQVLMIQFLAKPANAAFDKIVAD